MDLYEIYGDEQHPIYQKVAAGNYSRHHDFLYSMIEVAVSSERPWLSESLIKAINFHAIVGLHHEAGQYRTPEVEVGSYTPPAHYRIKPLMEDCVNEVNWKWERTDLISLAAWALWRINYIHPFVNGNGRTARAVCYYILCVKAGGLLPGTITLPELLRKEPVRTLYVNALQQADKQELAPLVSLIQRIVAVQLSLYSQRN